MSAHRNFEELLMAFDILMWWSVLRDLLNLDTGKYGWSLSLLVSICILKKLCLCRSVNFSRDFKDSYCCHHTFKQVNKSKLNFVQLQSHKTCELHTLKTCKISAKFSPPRAVMKSYLTEFWEWPQIQSRWPHLHHASILAQEHSSGFEGLWKANTNPGWSRWWTQVLCPMQ